MKPLALTYRLGEDAASACDFLAAASGLPKARIKDAMNKGAVWHGRGKAGQQRLRRASKPLRAGDTISLYYDPEILARTPLPARLLADQRHYGVWYKPAGMLAQGTFYGDHCALLRLAEQAGGQPRYLVHRLDREAEGLMLLAHHPEAAARFSRLFHNREIEKVYHAWVLGDPGPRGEIDAPLDNKPARTGFERLAWKAEENAALLRIRIETGRKHQIRRHLAGIGHPLLGDPRYGEGNQNRAGLRLAATRLAFICPFRRQPVCFELADYVENAWWRNGEI